MSQILKPFGGRDKRYWAASRRRRILAAAAGGATNAPGDLTSLALNVTWNDGGTTGASDISPVMDVIDNVGREVSAWAWSEDGTKLAAAHNAATGPMASFSCSTPFDFSTATQTGSTNSYGGLNFPYGSMWWCDNGNKIAWHGSGADRLYVMSLATAYTIASTDSTVTTCLDTEVNPDADASDGAMWVDPYNGNYVALMADEVNVTTLTITPLTTPWDLTTVDTANRTEFNVESEIANNVTPFNSGMAIASDGGSVIVWDGTLDLLHKWEMSTAWDASTCGTHTERDLSGISTYDHMTVSPDFSKVYLTKRIAPWATDEYTGW